MMKRQPFYKFAVEREFALTEPQRALTMVCFDGMQPRDLHGADRDLVRTVLGPVDDIPNTAREVLAFTKGARAGFTRMCASRCYQLSLTVDVDLAPNENAFVLYIGPDLRLARQAINYALGMARIDAKNGAITIMKESTDAFTFERHHDGVIVTHETMPATVGGSAVRARTLIAAHMTEASFMRDHDFAINDADVFRALPPRIVPGGQILVESTPWMASGLLHDLVAQNHGAPVTCIAGICPTLTMRPDPRMRQIVERELKRDEANALNEFYCIPKTTNAEQFFDALDACIDPKLPAVLTAPDGATVTAGGDLGVVENSSTCVVGADHNKLFVPLEILELKPTKGKPLRLSFVVQEFATVLKRHGVKSFIADHHLIDPAREWASVLGITIRATKGGNEPKTAQYIALRQAMREGRVRLPNNPRLLAQLRSIKARPISGGALNIVAPTRAGAHADIVSALVLCHAGTTSGLARWTRAVQGWNAGGGQAGACGRLGIDARRLLGR